MTDPVWDQVRWDEETLGVFYGGMQVGRLKEERGHWRWGEQAGAIAYTIRGAAYAMVKAHLNRDLKPRKANRDE